MMMMDGGVANGNGDDVGEGLPYQYSRDYQDDDNNNGGGVVGGGMIMSMMDDLAYGGGEDSNNYHLMNSPTYLGGGGMQENNGNNVVIDVDFDDPRIASLPRILLMGPRRAGKTSIQRVVFHKMSPHETLFRLEATQTLERAVVDHTPLCRFTIWDFPGEQYEYSGGGYDYLGGGEDGYNNGNIDEEARGGGGEDVLGLTSSPLRKRGGGGNATTNRTNSSSDDQIFAKATALIFVLDAQDEPYDHVLQSFTDTVTRATLVYNF